MHLFRICLFFSVLIFSSLFLSAQRPGGEKGGQRPDMSKIPPEGIVFGKVVDKTTGDPMEFTNVVLYSMRDSSIVIGTLTDEKGKFRMEKVRKFRKWILGAGLVSIVIGYILLGQGSISAAPALLVLG